MSISSSLRQILFLCIFPCYYYSTLYAGRITHLPGFNGSLPFHLETGYVTVNEESGAELFYYLVESERNPRDDPLILWLPGGPYCAAFQGLALDIGPLRFKVKAYDGSLPTLIYNPYSWTKWLLHHSRFQSNSFYVAGDSYGGKMAPMLALEIVEGNENFQQLFINLKGYIVGNPVTGERIDVSFQAPYAHGLGIISDELLKMILKNCEEEDDHNPKSVLCDASLNIMNEFFSEINIYSILEPKCADDSLKLKELEGEISSIKEKPVGFICSFYVPDIDCTNDLLLSYYWSNDKFTKEALGIKEVHNVVLKQSNICNCEGWKSYSSIG